MNRKLKTKLQIKTGFLLLIAIFFKLVYINSYAFGNVRSLIEAETCKYIQEKIIFCFWTGENKMSNARLVAFEKLKIKSRCKVILVTQEVLADYILPDAPLHPAYKYLSETHKADYLRTYFMHFYGGGYSDIKAPTKSWVKAFNDIMKRPNAFINGYREVSESDIAFTPAAHLWDRLVGNCAYIVRPKTPFTNKWYKEMIELLDKRYEMLRDNPSRFPQDRSELMGGYPIGWNEMLGRIFHKHLVSYIDNIIYSVPRPICINYR